MDTFCCYPPKKNISEIRKWLLAVTVFDSTNSVFNTIDEIKSVQLQRLGFGFLQVANKLLANKMNY